MVSDWAVGNPESEPTANDIAAAEAASHRRNLILALSLQAAGRFRRVRGDSAKVRRQA
jgi:hypothetical protein